MNAQEKAEARLRRMGVAPSDQPNTPPPAEPARSLQERVNARLRRMGFEPDDA